MTKTRDTRLRHQPPKVPTSSRKRLKSATVGRRSQASTQALTIPEDSAGWNGVIGEMMKAARTLSGWPAAAMQPIAGWSNGHNLAGGRPSAAKTGTNQLGDTGANRDAWMVGFTPSLSTAVWVGTVNGDKPLVNQWGGPVYGSGLPSDIWKATMDGALQGSDWESFPKPTEVGGYAGVPQPVYVPPPAPATTVVGPSNTPKK